MRGKRGKRPLLGAVRTIANHQRGILFWLSEGRWSVKVVKPLQNHFFNQHFIFYLYIIFHSLYEKSFH